MKLLDRIKRLEAQALADGPAIVVMACTDAQWDADEQRYVDERVIPLKALEVIEDAGQDLSKMKTLADLRKHCDVNKINLFVIHSVEGETWTEADWAEVLSDDSNTSTEDDLNL